MSSKGAQGPSTGSTLLRVNVLPPDLPTPYLFPTSSLCSLPAWSYVFPLISVTARFVSGFAMSGCDWEAWEQAASEAFFALLSISLLPWPSNQVWKQPCPGFTQSLSSKKSQNGFASQSDYTHFSGQGKRLFGKWSLLPKTVLTTAGESYRMTGQLSHWHPGLPAGPP